MIQDNIETGKPLSTMLRDYLREWLSLSDLKEIEAIARCSMYTMKGLISDKSPQNITRRNIRSVDVMIGRAVRNRGGYKAQVDQKHEFQTKELEKSINHEKELIKIEDQSEKEIVSWSQNKFKSDIK